LSATILLDSHSFPTRRSSDLSHANGYQELAEIMEVTAVCDVDIERVTKAKEATGATYAVQDYKELLPYVDAVLVVLPHDLHFEVDRKSTRLNSSHVKISYAVL